MAGTDPIDYTALERGRDCNYWAYDRALQRTVRRRCDPDGAVVDLLAAFGELVGTRVAENAATVEEHPPELRRHDRHGERVDEVEYHPAHFENERLVYENGVVANWFSAPPGHDEPLSALEHFAQFYLMDYGSGAELGCPAAMTSGAALVLERFDDGALDDYYDAMTTRDYDDLETAAMFLTEKQGGSDVGANRVRAEPVDDPERDDVHELSGEKWFCSNVDSDAALVLARRPGAPDGTEGLSLFLVPGERRDGSANDYRIRRLKDKLGTRALPTGEVVFEGAEGYLIGESERGFRYMSEMLNAERLYNAIGSVATIGRLLLESKRHTAEREVFGDRLADQPLMRRDLVDMAVDHEAAMAVTFEAADWFGRRAATADPDNPDGTDEHAHRLMRILVPVAKYRTARMAVDTASYAMEIRGGDGYVEEFVHPRLLRNAQVLPIWEGAANVMALDVLRAMLSELSHEALLTELRGRLDDIEDPRLAEPRATVADELDGLADAFDAVATTDPAGAQHEAKELADYIFDVTAGVVLLERAAWRLDAGDAREALVAEWFARTHLESLDARGIPDEERLPIEAFDAIVRYARAEPEQVVEA